MSEKIQKDIACDECGLPSDIAIVIGVKLELLTDGKVICDMCKKFKPLLDEMDNERLKHMSEKVNCFANYIDASAFMFEVGAAGKSIACIAVTIRSIDNIAKNDKSLALRMAAEFVKDFENLQEQLNTKYPNIGT